MYRLILFLFLSIFLGCTPPARSPDVVSEAPPQRIISTLPSITEVLFDIGLGDRIVGDSSFTKYPPEAATIDKIGGLGVNIEKIISLKPDLIIVLEEDGTLRQSLSVPVLTVDPWTLNGMLESYLIIGELFGPDVLAVAQQKRQELIDKINAFDTKIQRKKPIRTLISIDRSRGTGRIQNLYVARADSFLTLAVAKAGGENVAASPGLLTPTLSAEGVIGLAPDVIIDIQVDGTDTAQGVVRSGVSDWYSLGDSVPAVKHRRILTLTDDFASIPGPRTPMLIEKIAQYYDSIEP
jgi:iron complex transport system substrate-binding protein